MRTVVITGVAISGVGAALDFASGYYMLQGGSDPMYPMNSPALAFGLFALGGVVIVAGLALLLPAMAGKMLYLGAVMEVSGVAMAIVSSYAPGMAASTSLAMLVVGALMIINGAMMQRRMKTEMKP